MPLDPSNLVGIWCCPCGGFLGYDLIFRPDRMGRAEASNCVLTNVLVFSWHLDGDELVVSGREVIELNEPQDGVVHLPWRFEHRVRITLGSVTLENGDVCRTLTLASPLDDDWPLEYLAGNPKYDVFAEPDFNWIWRLRRGN